MAFPLGEWAVVRRAVCIGVLWVAAFSGCDYAQDRSTSRRSQVVLIARLPDTFAVNPPQVGRSADLMLASARPAGIELGTVGQLIPGTDAATACVTSSRGRSLAFAVSQEPKRRSLGREPSAVGIKSECDGSFQLLRGATDSIAIEAPSSKGGDRDATRRVDVIFSIF